MFEPGALPIGGTGDTIERVNIVAGGHFPYQGDGTSVD
jgi:hypothetical protein